MKVGIIGGGAAGIMSALFACKRRDEVTLIEHGDRLGRKLLSTGNGKCNFTNINLTSKHYHGNIRAVKLIEKFNQFDTIRFFNDLGIVEFVRDGYVYPNSEQAASVRDALLMGLRSCNIKIVLNADIIGINKKKEQFSVNYKDIETGRSSCMRFDKLIVAAGLLAAPKLGSDGSLLPVLSRLGVRYNKCLPALCSMQLDNRSFFRTVSGVRAKGEICICIDGRNAARDFGELQFNDTGVSGIPAFGVSRYASLALDKKRHVEAVLDMFSHLGDIGEILRKRKNIKSLITLEELGSGLINKKLWTGILKLSGLQNDTDIERLDGEKLKRLINICKDLRFEVLQMANFDKCQVCTGGVSLDALDDNLMYKNIKNLYFAGEIIDVDGICGGYNLQWAWSSGFIAGSAELL